MNTMDMYLASYLMARGHSIRVVKRVLPTGRQACEFHFPPEAMTDAREFDAGASISAPVLTDALKRLKILIAKTPLSTPMERGR